MTTKTIERNGELWATQSSARLSGQAQLSAAKKQSNDNYSTQLPAMLFDSRLPSLTEASVRLLRSGSSTTSRARLRDDEISHQQNTLQKTRIDAINCLPWHPCSLLLNSRTTAVGLAKPARSKLDVSCPLLSLFCLFVSRTGLTAARLSLGKPLESVANRLHAVKCKITH